MEEFVYRSHSRDWIAQKKIGWRSIPAITGSGGQIVWDEIARSFGRATMNSVNVAAGSKKEGSGSTVSQRARNERRKIASTDEPAFLKI